ncbi:BON domain-containing protein [Sphaerisporangium corydalis]|uniref:BON domain-containing protein n=1 Tax=Sphaerisporangium corydalis TaxID=1441875 RepID=A0ABV9ENJ3_9ACTN|nr:BON domain-containing protein [Sphaerisporangium corydalis]
MSHETGNHTVSHEAASHEAVPHEDAPHGDAPHYVAARVQRALAEDERTYELGIRVDIRGDLLFLRGQVEGDERRLLVAAVAGETAPGLKVRNEVTVVEVRDPGEEETL